MFPINIPCLLPIWQKPAGFIAATVQVGAGVTVNTWYQVVTPESKSLFGVSVACAGGEFCNIKIEAYMHNLIAG